MEYSLLVWIEQLDGQADPIAWQAMAAAEKIAGSPGGPGGPGSRGGPGGSITAAVFGDGAGDIARQAVEAGADRVYISDDPSLDRYRVEPYAKLLARILESEPPSVVLMGASTAGLELSAYAAALAGAGLAPDCTDLCLEGDRLAAIRPALVGNLVSTVTFRGAGPRFITVRRNVFQPAAPDANRTGEIIEVPAVLSEEEIPTSVASVETADGTVSLTEASIIVSGGRGVGGPEGFQPVRELAEALGGALGASRAAVDAGWIPYAHQVGQTGKTVQPDLYIACGISGAIQHLAGMKNARVIVAINKDADVPLYKYAHYGIAGDLFSYLPAIAEEVKKRLSR